MKKKEKGGKAQSNETTDLNYIFQILKSSTQNADYSIFDPSDVYGASAEMSSATGSVLVRNHDATGCPHDNGQHENKVNQKSIVTDQRQALNNAKAGASGHFLFANCTCCHLLLQNKHIIHSLRKKNKNKQKNKKKTKKLNIYKYFWRFDSYT